MLSTDLAKFGFNQWLKINTDYEANKKLILSLPAKEGVYVIRASKPFPRIKGESDIIYVGQGKIQSRIQSLLRSYLPLNFRKYFAKHTAREDLERIIEELKWELEFSFILSEDSKSLETQILQKYRADHIEPPPLNHTRR